MTELKICGLTNRDDPLAAVDVGADYLGFIFYSGSARGVTAKEIAGFRADLPDSVKTVGVFVNEPLQRVLGIAADCNLDVVQIHGDETAADFAGCGVPLWRAVHVESAGWTPDPAAWLAERYVVDAFVRGAYGGTGVVADWDMAAALAGDRVVMLAGGLTPTNVGEAIARVKPCGVDVAGGIEKSPGVKDHGAMARFAAVVKTGFDE